MTPRISKSRKKDSSLLFHARRRIAPAREAHFAIHFGDHNASVLQESCGGWCCPRVASPLSESFFRPARIRDLRVTSNCVGHLRFDVRNLDIGVPPTRRQPDDDFMFGSDLYAVRYDIADHGNGTRLSVGIPMCLSLDARSALDTRTVSVLGTP